MWSSCSRFRLALTPSRMWPREAPRVFGPGAVSPNDLGRDDHVLARHLQILQRLAGDLLRHAPGVHVGGVDEVDAGVNRLAHEALCVGLLQATDLARDAVGATEGHGAQAKLGDEQAGTAEGMVAHGRGFLVKG